RDFHVTGVQTCALPIWAPLHVRRDRARPGLERVRTEQGPLVGVTIVVPGLGPARSPFAGTGAARGAGPTARGSLGAPRAVAGPRRLVAVARDDGTGAGDVRGRRRTDGTVGA